MNNQTPTASEKDWALMCHVSPLIPLGILVILIFVNLSSDFWMHFLFFSRLIFPLVGWIIGSKYDSRWIVHHAKSALNFQITYSILFYIPLIIVSIIVNYALSDFAVPPDMIESNSYDIEPIDGLAVALVLMPIALLVFVTEGILLLSHLIFVVKAGYFAVEPIEETVGETSRLIYPNTYALVIPFFRT